MDGRQDKVDFDSVPSGCSGTGVTVIGGETTMPEIKHPSTGSGGGISIVLRVPQDGRGESMQGQQSATRRSVCEGERDKNAFLFLESGVWSLDYLQVLNVSAMNIRAVVSCVVVVLVVNSLY